MSTQIGTTAPASNIVRLRRILGIAAVSLFALAATGCGGGDDIAGPGPDTSGDDTGTSGGPGLLTITNGSNRSAWYLYIRSCGSQNWGPDRLGLSILQIDETNSFAASAGCYDVRAKNGGEAAEYEIVLTNITVDAAGTSLMLQSEMWQAVAATSVPNQAAAAKR
jgi:hypothetical protein